MIKKGDRVTIKCSSQLIDMKLAFLVGYSGVVTKTMYDNKMPGCYVKLDTVSKKGQVEWYVPVTALQSAENLEIKRKTSIIGSFKI